MSRIWIRFVLALYAVWPMALIPIQSLPDYPCHFRYTPEPDRESDRLNRDQGHRPNRVKRQHEPYPYSAHLHNRFECAEGHSRRCAAGRLDRWKVVGLVSKSIRRQQYKESELQTAKSK